MLAPPTLTRVSHPTVSLLPARWRAMEIQAQSNDLANDPNRASVSDLESSATKLPWKAPLNRRNGKKLKKSKTMQAFSAALAAKNRQRVKEDSPLNSDVDKSTSSTVLLHKEAFINEEKGSNGLLTEARELLYPSQEEKHFKNDPDDFCVLPKPIYIVSDCTGHSAARTVKAALRQFESSIQTHCPTSLLIYRFVADKNRIQQIVKDAAKENALVVFTLVDPELVDTIQNACASNQVKAVDLWSNLLDLMEGHLEALRSVLPLMHPSRERKRTLNADYFKRIEAVEFTRKMDDGANPERWHEADIMLLGVSRSGKTPLSIYLGQRGYKVANLPLIPGYTIPKELYEIDQSKIFGLIIDHEYLMKIRQSRMGSMGVKNRGNSMYAELQGVIKELDYAENLYLHNPYWPVLNVTCMGVEETAANILRVLSERYGSSEPVIMLGGH